MEAQNQPKKSRMPHIYVILISLIALGALMTYIIPAGKYERVTNEEGMEVVQPDSFQFIEQTPVGLFDFMLAIPNGFIETAELVFGIIMIGGMFAVIEKPESSAWRWKNWRKPFRIGEYGLFPS